MNNCDQCSYGNIASLPTNSSVMRPCCFPGKRWNLSLLPYASGLKPVTALANSRLQTRHYASSRHSPGPAWQLLPSLWRSKLRVGRATDSARDREARENEARQPGWASSDSSLSASLSYKHARDPQMRTTHISSVNQKKLWEIIRNSCFRQALILEWFVT